MVKTELRRLGFTFVSQPGFEPEMTMAAGLLIQAAAREKETPEELKPSEDLEALTGLAMALMPDPPNESDRHYAAEQELAQDPPAA